MPNHITNTIWFESKSDADKVKEFMTTEESEFDFNVLIPYPKEYAEKDRIAREYEKENPGNWKDRPKDGFNSGGYEWCIANWGTKWNAYNIEWIADYAEMRFDTAWSTPEPIFEALKAKFPAIRFSVGYYDEDMYSDNRGVLEY